MVFSRRLSPAALGSLALVLAATAVPAQAARVTNRTAASVTLKFASWDPASVTDLFINSCAKKLGYQVINQFIPYSGYPTKIQTEFAAGTAPDFFYGLEDHTLTWGAQGALLNQIPYRKELHASISDALPYSLWWNHGKVGSELFGQGTAVEDYFLYYNKNTLAQAGVSAPPSDAAHAWTWSQFVAVAKKLTMDRHGKHPGQSGFDARHIVRYGVTIGDAWGNLLPFVYSNGGTAFDSSYKHFTLNQPAAAAAVQAVADLSTKDHVAPTPNQTTSGAGSLTLATGRVAMMVSGNWDVYFQQNPKVTYPMGIGVLPRFKQYATTAVGGPMVVWAHTKHPLEAVKMALCIAQNSQPLWKNGIWMPTIKSEYTESALKSWTTSSAHPSNYVQVAVNTLKYAHDAPEIKTAQFAPAWTDVVGPALDNVFNGHTTAQSALDSIKSRVDAILAQGR
jgi:multiple sugar transport system substrate-binding protein